jgi:hypothetical protein
VFDAQLVAQQRLQAAGITTLVSSKEVGSTYYCCATTRALCCMLRSGSGSRISISGRDGDILQEGRRHDGGQPLGVAPHGAGDARRDQHRGRAHHLPPQGRAWRRLPFARHQPLPQM